MQTTEFLYIFAAITQHRKTIMRKKYLLWGYAVIAFSIIVILCSIAITSFISAKGARNHIANPENRMKIYETAANVSRDTGLEFPEFRIHQHKPGEYLEDGVFRDTLIVFFYKGIPNKVYESFENRARAIEADNDTAKSVEIDSLDYRYQDFYVGGFSSYVGVHINKKSQYGEIIFGNWKKAKE